MKPNCTNPEWVGRAKCAACEVRNFVLFSGLKTHELDSILQPIDNLAVFGSTNWTDPTTVGGADDFAAATNDYLQVIEFVHDNAVR